jgi:hypothetical protein
MSGGSGVRRFCHQGMAGERATPKPIPISVPEVLASTSANPSCCRWVSNRRSNRSAYSGPHEYGCSAWVSA